MSFVLSPFTAMLVLAGAPPSSGEPAPLARSDTASVARPLRAREADPFAAPAPATTSTTSDRVPAEPRILGALSTSTTSTTSGPGRRAPDAAVDLAFVKGDFANAGSIRLVPKRSFIGIRLGIFIQDEPQGGGPDLPAGTTLFATIAPKVDLQLLERKLRIGVEVPLNFQIYNVQDAADAKSGGSGFNHLFRLRQRDWADARDFMKVLRYVTYGAKEDNLYLNLGQLYATTIGHGQIMRRYASNVDLNAFRVGGEVDAYGDYGGFELSLADVTRGNLFAVLGFVKPLAPFTEDAMARSLSIGLTWATDQKAPAMLERFPPIAPSRVGAVRAVNEPNMRCGDTGAEPLGSPCAITGSVNVFGIDSEIKLVKTKSIDLKTYVDFSLLDHAGNGITLGALGRFNFHAGSAVHLLRTRLELRSYDSNFQPSYFDVLYEFQKFTYVTNQSSTTLPTKLAYISGRNGPRRVGVYVEASYALVDWFIAAIAFETETEGQDQHLMLHVEIPLRWFDLFATYQQRALSKLFTFDVNDVFYAGARLKLLPFLFVNSRIQKIVAWDASLFNSLGGYASKFNYLADVEIGAEF